MFEADIAMAQQELDRAFIAGDYIALRRLTDRRFQLVNPLSQILLRDQWLAWLETSIRYRFIARQDPLITTFEGGAIGSCVVDAQMAVVGLADGEFTLHRTRRSEVWIAGPGGATLLLVHLTAVPTAQDNHP